MPKTEIQKESVDIKQLNHSLRNPLYVAKTLLEAHLSQLGRTRSDSNGLPSQETRLILKKSVYELNRALSALTRLNRMAISRSSKNANGKIEKVSVKEVLDRVVTALKEEHYLDHIILVDWVSSQLPLACVNYVDLEEIFYNLIVNAAQAMIGGGQLAIDASFELHPNPIVSVSLRDTGPGIPEEALEHIFDPFYTSKSESGATGFGLHIVKELIARNNGRIEVKSRRLIGSTFTISFPAAPVS